MIFNMAEQDFLNRDYLKAITGCAGIAKSSKTINALRDLSEPFIWLTASNRQKRDAIERYGVDAFTVCSALFVNENGRFYGDFKQPPEGTRTIVIDEILLTSIRVIEWIKEFKGQYNIIILTDTHQMLTKGIGKEKKLLREFLTLCNQSNVKLYEGTSTKRARTQETKEKIETLYQVATQGRDAFVADLKAKIFPVMYYEDLDYNTNDVFITHKNISEEQFYKDHRLSTAFFDNDMLIPKGSIANKPPRDLSKYPLMSQKQAEETRSRAYTQLMNIGSCTRYQGSECRSDQKLYYIITPDSVVTNREWYTVVSRCWDIRSIHIVVHRVAKREPLRELRGIKIKDVETLSITDEIYQKYKLPKQERQDENNEDQ